MTGFSHVSLLIDLDHEWWSPKITAFLDPASYFPRRARMLVHETIHYWQQLSSGYLLAMAQEDWEQLLSWEQGVRPALGPLRGGYRRPEGLHHFSSYRSLRVPRALLGGNVRRSPGRVAGRRYTSS